MHKRLLVLTTLLAAMVVVSCFATDDQGDTGNPEDAAVKDLADDNLGTDGAEVCAMPTNWGTVGVSSNLGGPTDIIAKDFFWDYDDDNNGDCRLNSWILGYIPPGTEGGLFRTKNVLLFEFVGVRNFINTSSFNLNLLLGTPENGVFYYGDMLAFRDSYNNDSCLPRVVFESARIDKGKLIAGPANIEIPFTTSDGFQIIMPLVDVRISADTGFDEAGMSARNGKITGILLLSEMNRILDEIKVRCAVEPVPAELSDKCKYIEDIRDSCPEMCDLYRADDGTYTTPDADHMANASSICFRFDMAGGAVTGYHAD